MRASDSEGFRLVVRGGRPKQGSSSHRPGLSEYCGPPSKDIVATIQSTRDVPELIQYASLIIDLLQSTCYQDIVCYGIGRIGMCYIACHQLALLLHMAKEAKSVMIYDPVLGVEERTALEELGCVYIDNNERCQRQVQVHTLFYMPHCGRAMYNNLLWANWSPQHLSKVAVIGNSFHSYLERSPQQHMRENASFILKVMEHCFETPLPPYIVPTVFNDLSLHTFPIGSLVFAPPAVWAPSPPPPLLPSDPEII